MTSRSIAATLQIALTNGHPAMTYAEIACADMSIKKATAADIAAVIYYRSRFRRRLEKVMINTVLVTDWYFQQYYNDGEEPTTFKDAVPCIALNCRASEGVRLATLKDAKNDIIFTTAQELNANSGAGKLRAVLNRIMIELAAGNLTEIKAAKLVRYVLAYKEPDLGPELKQFLKDQNIRLIESRNGK